MDRDRVRLFHLPNLVVGSGPTQLIQVVLAAISGATLYAFRRYRGLILTAMIAHGIWDMSAFLSDSNGRDWLGAASLLLVVGGLVLGILVLVSVWRTDKTTVVTPAGIEQKQCTTELSLLAAKPPAASADLRRACDLLTRTMGYLDARH